MAIEHLGTETSVARISDLLNRDGIVRLEGVHTRDAVVALARRLLDVHQHRDADGDGVTEITEVAAIAGRPGFAGFGVAPLHPHTESSALLNPPRLLLLICGAPAERGGESIVVDGAAVYADLAASQPAVLEQLSAPRSYRFAPQRWGAIFTSSLDGHVEIRLRMDGLEYVPGATRAVFPALRDAIGRHMQLIPMDAGQGYLLDNRRILHGRRRFFGGNRVMYRVLGNPTSAVSLPAGFFPSIASMVSPGGELSLGVKS